ncbi:MAG: tetratricopeptide repeat protein [FCB group bacterium]
MLDCGLNVKRRFKFLKKVFLFSFTVLLVMSFEQTKTRADEKDKCVVMNLDIGRSSISEGTKEIMKTWYLKEIKQMTRFEILSSPERDEAVKKYNVKIPNWDLIPKDAKDLFLETPIKFIIHGFIFDDPESDKIIVEIFLNDTSPETVHISHKMEKCEKTAEEIQTTVKTIFAQLNDPLQDNKTTLSDLHLTPKDYLTSGTIEFNRGNLKDAIREFSRAIAIKPDFTEAYMGRAKCFVKSGQNESALSDYEKILKINPRETEAYKNRGIIKNSIKDNQGALAEYNKGLNIEPNNSELYMYRGLAKADMDDKKGALQDLKKAVSISNDYMSLYELAETEYRFGDTEDALSNYTKAINAKPDYAVLYFKRGNLKSETGDKEGACTDWKKAGQLGNKDARDKIKKLCK